MYFYSLSNHYQICHFSSAIPISEIDIGDEVLAYNEATGETDSYTVVATIQHTDPVIVLLTIDGETLETTADHPFYTEDGEWVEAADLELGDDIRTLDGDTGEVEAVLFLERTQPMYNLTVAEAHTFFVGDGQWLVHNTGDDCIPSRSPKSPNLPSTKKVKLDMDHIVSGHKVGGSRVTTNSTKTLFPEYMSRRQIEKTIKSAYAHGKRIKTQGDSVLVRGVSDEGIIVDIWIDTKTKVIKTAYPRWDLQ